MRHFQQRSTRIASVFVEVTPLAQLAQVSAAVSERFLSDAFHRLESSNANAEGPVVAHHAHL
jgi:hypothetical protein